uniref:Gnk2-homologous domain-containing protein n=1 Tax=Oryza brachyantha TaxID=4533 RepID=J3LGU2_ORYBR
MATATSVAATVLLSLLLLARARGADDDYSGFVYAGCSQGRYASGTPYASDVDSVLTSVANSAPYAPYANFTSPTSSSVAGLYQCRSDLPASLKAGCGYATAGEVYLGKCYARFWGNGGGGFSSGASRNGYGFGPRVHGDRLALAAAGGFFTSLAYFTLVLI